MKTPCGAQRKRGREPVRPAPCRSCSPAVPNLQPSTYHPSNAYPRLVEAHHGLTLVEVTVVIAVIALLASILFPVFARAREAARATSCRTHLHQIGLALHAYARDHDGRLPVGEHLTPLLGTHIPLLSTFACPSDSTSLQIGGTRYRTRSSELPWKNGRPALPAGELYCSYQYRGGLSLDHRGAERVAGDWQFRHSERALVLTLAGEVLASARHQWIPYAHPPSLPDASPAAATPFRLKPGQHPTRLPVRPPASAAPAAMPGTLPTTSGAAP